MVEGYFQTTFVIQPTRLPVPFGVNASPFLLAASIRLYLVREVCPLVTKFFRTRMSKRNVSKRNVIMGATSSKEAFEKYRQAKTIFNRMRMNLREFLCNDQAVNGRITPKDLAINPTNASLLEIRWQYAKDRLLITLSTKQIQVTTKRTALRALSSTYDPLGLLTPFLTPVKVFIQDLWAKNLTWDTPLDAEDLEKWRQLVDVSLPTERVTKPYPFQNIGIGYLGPLPCRSDGVSCKGSA